MFNNDFLLGSTNSLAELSYQKYLASQQNQSKSDDSNLLNIPNYSLLSNENQAQQTSLNQGNNANNNFMDESLFFNMKEQLGFLGNKYQDDIFASQLYKSKPWEKIG